MTISRFQQIDGQVVDGTGLKEFYDFKLTFTPEPSGGAGPNGEPLASFEGSNMAQALREQLGLRVQNTRNAVQVFILDGVERPSKN